MRLAAELGKEEETLATRLGHALALFAYHEVAVSARHWAASPNLAELEASARRHLEVAGAMGFRHHSGALLARAAFLRGNWEDALREAEEGVRHAPEHHHTTGREWAAYLLILAHLDRPAEVVAALDGLAEEYFPRPGRRNGYGPWYLVPAAIEALVVIGERDRAAGLYPLLREYMDSTGAILLCFAPSLLERVAAIGAAAGRQWDLAEEHFATALRQAEELPFVIEGAETRRWYARMLLDRDGPGDRDRARSLVEEAIPVYGRTGMPRHEELARTLLLR
jgi:tetratricopeptide (TPR) repeat protein